MPFFVRCVLKSLNISPINTEKLTRKVRLCLCSSNLADLRFVHNHTPSSNGAKFKTVGAILKMWREKFARNTISEPQESIVNILAYCLGTTKLSDVYKLKEATLSEEKLHEIQDMCEKRLKNMPVQYVIGEWPFRFLNLKMVPPVFIPRPETEELVDIVLSEIARNNTTSVLDLCCGSGAISLSLLHERPNIKATAVDQSKAACNLTKENAQKNGLNGRITVVHSRLSDWKASKKFDMIVSNPPYVFDEDLKKLQPEIAMYEDPRALGGGKDGLEVIKVILQIASEYLNENGKLFLEVEPRHPQLLRNYLLVNGLGLTYVDTCKDFAGKERFVKMIKT